MDDPVTPKNSMIMGAALQEAGVSSEVHLYDGGGHGFGLRPSRFPCTTWPDAAEKLMSYRGILPD
jgi:acetyl esterase/lipase